MEANQVFQFRGLSKQVKVACRPLGIGRYLVGSVDNCDVHIQDPSIKPIHAVLEITPNGHKIYRLDSDSSLLINGESRDVSDIKAGDTVKIGNVVIDFNLFSDEKMPTLPGSSKVGDKQARNQSVIKDEQVEAPYLIYPFGEDYNFDQSEYIFEDNHEIFPIFKYKVDKQAVEVIIIHKNRIFSVDYLVEKDGHYNLAGMRAKDNDIEYPYLQKKDQVNFIESRGGVFNISKLQDYSLNIFSNDKDKVSSQNLELGKDDIFSFKKGDISIVLRNVESPPEVKAPPVLPRDKTLFIMLILAFIMVSIPLFFIYNAEVDKEEIEKEKAPERIAKILYKRKKFKKIIKKTPSKTQAKTKKLVKKKKNEIKKIVKKAPGPKIKVKTPPKKVAKGNPPKKVDNKKNPNPPKKNTSTKKASTSKSISKSNKKPGPVGTKSKQTTRTASPTPNSRGTVDVYKSSKFKPSISTLMAKGGQFKGVKTSGTSSGGGGAGFTGTQGVSGGSGVSTSTVSGKIGSPNGVKNGAQTFSAGAEGLTGTKSYFTAGIPSDTAVLGSMDPSLIRKILRDHIPQFRYCYQSELDRMNEKFAGSVKMTFTIGASGRVSKSGVAGSRKVPPKVKSCINRVLKGIQFPKPLGGGVVEVAQPLSLYSKNN